MAKIRSLKGEYFRHAGISHGGLVSKVLAAGLITAVADDEGRFKADSDYLRGEIFTHDEVAIGDIDEGLEHLERIDFIRLYRVHGRAFGVIKQWSAHQPVPPSRFLASKIPPPPSTKHRKHSASTPQAGRKHPSTNVSSRAGVGSDRKEDRNRNVRDKGEVGLQEPASASSNGHTFTEAAERLIVPVDHDVATVCLWFLDARGWPAFNDLDKAKHERTVAAQMLGILPMAELIEWLAHAWVDSDPDDRPSSLEYFWARLQAESHTRLKQQGRSHGRVEGMTKLDVGSVL